MSGLHKLFVMRSEMIGNNLDPLIKYHTGLRYYKVTFRWKSQSSFFIFPDFR